MSSQPPDSTPRDTGDPALLRAHIESIDDRALELHQAFFGRLFDRHPSAKALFGAFSQTHQFQMLYQMLMLPIDQAMGAPSVAHDVAVLAHTHHEYEVTTEMYTWTNDSLVDALAEVTGSAWTADLDRAWRAHLDAVARRVVAAPPSLAAPHAHAESEG